MPTNKINMAELLADREKGTDGPWLEQTPDSDGSIFIVGDNLGGLVGAAHCWPTEIDEGGSERVQANASRIARLPDLEDAFIEAVKALEIMAKDNYPSALTMNEMARTTLEKIRG